MTANRTPGAHGTRALVTGAGGFVGRWLTGAMRREDMQVTALATAPVPDGDASLDWIYGDLRDPTYVEQAVEQAAPDIVVHLAAISHLPTAAADPAMAWDVNVTSAARLLAALVKARDRRGIDPLVLMVGSAEQYGRQAGGDRIVETTAQEPRTVYAATKAAQETMALQVWRADGLRVVVARSFNHSGRGQEARFLLPALVARALALRDAPAGSPMVVGNTTPIRDYLHVSDVVRAYISLCRQGTPGEAYNVASGQGWSVAQVLERVLQRVGVGAAVVQDPALVRAVDVPALVGDPLKLQHATGWRATHSIDDIIDDLIHAATR